MLLKFFCIVTFYWQELRACDPKQVAFGASLPHWPFGHYANRWPASSDWWVPGSIHSAHSAWLALPGRPPKLWPHIKTCPCLTLLHRMSSKGDRILNSLDHNKALFNLRQMKIKLRSPTTLWHIIYIVCPIFCDNMLWRCTLGILKPPNFAIPLYASM